MGEGWLRHLAMVQGVRAKVDSAGTSAHHVGEGPDRRSISAMRAVDIDISGQRSRQFERNDFKNFDRILVMDQANLRDVLSMAKTEQDRAKVALFDPTGASVPDLRRHSPAPRSLGSSSSPPPAASSSCRQRTPQTPARTSASAAPAKALRRNGRKHRRTGRRRGAEQAGKRGGGNEERSRRIATQ